MDNAYLAGYDAYNRGGDAGDNPYELDTPEWSAWNEGFCSAGFDDCDQLLDVSDDKATGGEA